MECQSDFDEDNEVSYYGTGNRQVSSNSFNPFQFNNISSKRFVVDCLHFNQPNLFGPSFNTAPSLAGQAHLLQPDAFLSSQQG